jgi:hypothetical protein
MRFFPISFNVLIAGIAFSSCGASLVKLLAENNPASPACMQIPSRFIDNDSGLQQIAIGGDTFLHGMIYSKKVVIRKCHTLRKEYTVAEVFCVMTAIEAAARWHDV